MPGDVDLRLVRFFCPKWVVKESNHIYRNRDMMLSSGGSFQVRLKFLARGCRGPEKWLHKTGRRFTVWVLHLKILHALGSLRGE
jgi:hypothetical protein